VVKLGAHWSDRLWRWCRVVQLVLAFGLITDLLLWAAGLPGARTLLTPLALLHLVAASCVVTRSWQLRDATKL